MHYKDSKNVVYWLDPQDDPVKWLPADCVPISDAEAAALRKANAPVPTTQQVLDAYSNAVTGQLNTFAHTWGYDSIVSAASYAASTNAKFKAEALALIAWRDAVWAFVEAAAADATAAPTLDGIPAFLTTLPPPPTRPV
jgi:hypothetical protein